MVGEVGREQPAARSKRQAATKGPRAVRAAAECGGFMGSILPWTPEMRDYSFFGSPAVWA
jgi:hypothetical protein